MIDLSRPPPLNTTWLAEFSRSFTSREPRATAVEAIEHGVMAFRIAWLLDCDEAADLWLHAVRAQGWMPSRAAG